MKLETGLTFLVKSFGLCTRPFAPLSMKSWLKLHGRIANEMLEKIALGFGYSLGLVHRGFCLAAGVYVFAWLFGLGGL